jgi:hypothetical protein
VFKADQSEEKQEGSNVDETKTLNQGLLKIVLLKFWK